MGQYAATPDPGVYSRLGGRAVLGAEVITNQERHKEEEKPVTAIPVEYASERKIRERNKLYYRFNHWPIWIFVFFIAPGPLTFDLFERGFDSRLLIWLGLVLIGTAIAGLRGRLPGCEPRPYIIRFTEDRPNPLYRRVCYTTAWGEVIAFAVLNITANRCCDDPGPPEPKFRTPGFDFASATSSAGVFTCDVPGTTRKLGTV